MQKLKTIAGLAVAALLVLSALQAGTFQQAFAISAVDLNKNSSVTQHVNNDGTMTIGTIDFEVKKKTSKTSGEITVEVIQDGRVLASDTIATTELPKKTKKLTADLGNVELTGEFDIKISFEGKGGIKITREKAKFSSIDGYITGKKAPKNWNLKLTLKGEASENNNNPPAQPEGKITVYAYRMPSQYWAPTFAEANAGMWIVFYDASGELAKDANGKEIAGFANENGNVFAGFVAGEKYFVNPTDCEKCHGGDHDVVFDHWEDGSTQRQREVTATEDGSVSVGAYYRYVPPPTES